jgi:hypothetical protein
MKSPSDVVDAVAGAAESKPISALARAGLMARGLIWLIMGVLAVALGIGHSSQHVDQRGALSQLASEPFGTVLVVLLAIGFAAYAVWRLSEAAFGVTGEPPGKKGPRLQSLARGIAYLVLFFSAVSILLGSRTPQSSQQRSLTAQVMSHPGGRVVIAAVGVVIVAVGLWMVLDGWTAKFMKYFKSLPSRLRTTARRLGQTGTVGRGLVFALVGVLFVSAAWTASPGKAGGIDTAIRTTLEQPYGRWLVVVAGLALMAFGVYGLFEARYRRV